MNIEVTCSCGMEVETKLLSSKKLARLENKQKKMLAYLEVVKLNDHDREKSKKINNKKNEEYSEEPSCKKIKTDQPEVESAFEDICKNTEVLLDMNKNKKPPTGHRLLSNEEYEKVKQQLREKRSRFKGIPNFWLKDVGLQASVSISPDDRIPLFLSDIQHLILFTLLGNSTPYYPQRWCALERQSKIEHVIVMVIENLSLHHYINNADTFVNLNTYFYNKLEIVTPSVYKGDLIEEIVAVPLTSTQKDNLVTEYGSLESALQSSKVFNLLKAVFPVEDRVKIELEKKMILPQGDKFPRTHLLLSAWQMVEENYPLPLKGSLKSRFAHYSLTKDLYEEVTPNSPMFGLDCEMCRTITGELELTRISVVNEKHEVIYEKCVKPFNMIVDYLTQYSGITSAMLKNVTTRLEDVQRDLRELLPADAILVGQSLNSDLHALKLMHPYAIDTSVIFNLTGDRLRKTKLKILSKEFLDLNIQLGNQGHCSVEDSLASLKLVQLKLKHYIEYGDSILSGQKGCLKNFRLQGDNYYGSSLLHHITKIDKTVGLISQKDNLIRYQNYIHKTEMESKKRIISIPKETNSSIIKHICEKWKDYDVCINHVALTDGELSEAYQERTCHSVDKWVKKIWNSLGNSSLCIILFGGEVGNNGACFVQMKREQHVKLTVEQ